MFSALRLAAVLLVLSLPDVLAYNLIKNPDFVGISMDGWNTSGTASWESYLSAPADGAGGSLRLDSDPGTAHADQCVDVQKWLDIGCGSDQVQQRLERRWYAHIQARCLRPIRLRRQHIEHNHSSEAGTAVMGNNGATWTEVSVLGTPLPSGAISAKMNLDTAATSGSISYILLDHVQVVPPDEIFPDEFEGN